MYTGQIRYNTCLSLVKVKLKKISNSFDVTFSSVVENDLISFNSTEMLALCFAMVSEIFPDASLSVVLVCITLVTNILYII